MTQAKEEAWKWFSKFIRYRDALRTTKTLIQCKCITCGKISNTSKMQAGHFMPGRMDHIIFDERGVNGQCYRCNILLSGLWPAYYDAMLTLYGQDVINDMLLQWKTGYKEYTVTELNALSDYYKMLVVDYESKL